MISDKNLLLIGSESHISKDYIDRYGQEYDNIIGIDFPLKSTYLSSYISVDFNQEEAFSDIEKYFDSLSLSFSQILFSSGINFMNNIFTSTIDDWDTTFNVNIRSIVFTLKAALNYMQKETAIVLIASQNGIVGHEDRIDYGPSKSSLIQLAKNLTVDYAKLKDKDIRVNCLSPSYIVNDSNRELLNSYIGGKLLLKIPYKKFVNLQEVSYALEFLLGYKSKAIRGQNIIIDYGYTVI